MFLNDQHHHGTYFIFYFFSEIASKNIWKKFLFLNLKSYKKKSMTRKIENKDAFLKSFKLQEKDNDKKYRGKKRSFGLN